LTASVNKAKNALEKDVAGADARLMISGCNSQWQLMMIIGC